MSERIVVHILPEHFQAFKKLMPNDERLGKTYKEWIQRRAEADAGAGIAGMKQVTVKPEEFEMYCLQLRQIPNYSVLEALAAKKAREAT
jgi:hypothetical protein